MSTMSTKVAGKALPRIRGASTIIPELPRKLAQRAAQAQRQHIRNVRVRRIGQAKGQKIDRLVDTFEYKRELRGHVKNERLWRRQDRTLGVLAPKRDVGGLADTFGALDPRATALPLPKDKTRWGIVDGDRVVLVKRGHRDRGKIAVVKGVDEERETCLMANTNVGEIVVPDHILLKETDKTRVRAQELPLKLSDVRLVVALPDRATGRLVDTVVQEIELRQLTRRERKGIDPPTRVIAGVSPAIIIPYPPTEDATEAAEEYASDTLRIEVENRSWTPTLHMPPMPPDVLDELRNPYSKYRIRHDDWYIRKQLRIEDKAREGTKARRELMVTPLKLRRRKEVEARRRLGAPQLTDEALAAIGEVMERNLNLREQAVQEEIVKEKQAS